MGDPDAPSADNRPPKVHSPDEAELLPREMVWLYPLSALAAAPLLKHDLFSVPLDVALGMLVTAFMPWVVLSPTFHLLYRWVMPGLLRRLRSPAARGALHLVVTFAVAIGMAWLMRPWMGRYGGSPNGPLHFYVTCVIISGAVLFPALIVQRLRNRALLSERMAQAERQAALQAQIEALHARIQPHFFFNTLNAVASFIPRDPELAERTLERLADLFRYALESSKTRMVPLRREVDMVRDYVAIQQARYGSRLKVELEFDEGSAGFHVPPLLLQPLVENAILHGLANRQQLHVSIRIRREENRVTLAVEDDGPGPGASEHRGTQTSVRDLRERVLLVYGERGAFKLEPASTGGCRALLALPLGGMT
ncbi:sensor histidine kinase [Hyalangium versicolor]|uniref:sensor histidine kinase n=1 Tax=Hyalangium versicolor TaxID=2861190 RepID=UPI001CCE4775|nr:histidine kinase [Hyalangium versicolor]